MPPAERTGLELLAQPLLGNPAVPAGPGGSSTAPGAQAAAVGALDAPIATEQPMAHLHALLLRLRTMVQQVSSYVDDVVEGKKEGDVQVGKYLLDSIGAVPASKNGSTAFEEDFQAHLSVRSLLSLALLRDLDSHFSPRAGRPHGLLRCQPRPNASRDLRPTQPLGLLEGPHKTATPLVATPSLLVFAALCNCIEVYFAFEHPSVSVE